MYMFIRPNRFNKVSLPGGFGILANRKGDRRDPLGANDGHTTTAEKSRTRTRNVGESFRDHSLVEPCLDPYRRRKSRREKEKEKKK